MKKTHSAFICALLVCTLIFTGLSCIGEAQTETTIAKLPVPKLVSVTCEDHSYNVPASTATDPFTGNPVENPGYYVDNRTLTMVIDKKNINLEEPAYFYYIIRMKGSYSNEWDGRTAWIASQYISSTPNSQLTTLVFTSRSSPYSAQPDTTSLYCGGESLYLPLTGQADFQVQIIKQENVYYPPSNGWPSSWVETLTAESDWSNTKTLTFSTNSNEAPNQSNPTSNPTYPSDQPPQPELTVAGFSLVEFGLVITCVAIAVLSIALAYMYKHKASASKGGWNEESL